MKRIVPGTCYVVCLCFTTSASKPGKQVARASRMMVCPQCRKPFRKLLCLTINRGGRSHATMLRPSSSHELDSILVTLELPVAIYFQTILYFCVRRLYTNPPHLFTIYLTHGCPFAFLQRAIGNFSYTFLLGIICIKGNPF